MRSKNAVDRFPAASTNTAVTVFTPLPVSSVRLAGTEPHAYVLTSVEMMSPEMSTFIPVTPPVIVTGTLTTLTAAAPFASTNVPAAGGTVSRLTELVDGMATEDTFPAKSLAHRNRDRG